ncbi:MAG: hypothetical protein AAFX05_10425 [Planctomycetota bacterium]
MPVGITLATLAGIFLLTSGDDASLLKPDTLIDPLQDTVKDPERRSEAIAAVRAAAGAVALFNDAARTAVEQYLAMVGDTSKTSAQLETPFRGLDTYRRAVIHDLIGLRSMLASLLTESEWRNVLPPKED